MKSAEGMADAMTGVLCVLGVAVADTDVEEARELYSWPVGPPPCSNTAGTRVI